LFFFGFCEISSIPLAVVDFFHPKHFEKLTKSSKLLASINEMSRYSFAALFLMMRAIYFPYVVGFMLLPDIYNLLQDSRSGANEQVLYGIALSASSLTLLQLYWATLILKQVAKIGKKKKDN
jgi:hypothetical protein|tara:strand:+ start:373 stop:738 length:366 start_codon:yes stop_codon:yes gene_type:complete